MCLANIPLVEKIAFAIVGTLVGTIFMPRKNIRSELMWYHISLSFSSYVWKSLLLGQLISLLLCSSAVLCQILVENYNVKLPSGKHRHDYTATLKYNKPSVVSSFDPPKVEKRWRYYHTFDFFGPLKKSVMGSIPGADPVLFFVSPTVLGWTIIKIDLFLGLFRHKTSKFGQLRRLTRKDSPKKLCIKVDLNP